MPLQSTLRNEGKGLYLLSLDAGGARGISQLKILAEVMHRLNFELEEDQKLLPCDVFDMIGGSGTGGFIAILLVVLGLNVEKTLDDFIELSVNVLEKQGIDAPARTAALQIYIDKLLEKYNLTRDVRLMGSNSHSKGSKIVIPILSKRHIEYPRILRNFDASQEEALNFTIAEAILATLASPPLFTSMSISRAASTFEYISSDLKLSNPTRTIISEAYETFGNEARVACLLSIGSGHSGVTSVPKKSDLETWNRFLEKAVLDSEQRAEENESHMGHLALYHRFSVTRGLEREISTNASAVGDVIAHTTAYLAGVAVSRKLDLCTDSLRLRDGPASLEQLSNLISYRDASLSHTEAEHSGGQSVLPPALPLPTRTFVMRKQSWDFIEKVMLSSGGSEEADAPRMLVVTGMGGCGKTQLMLKFMHVHKSKFAATFFIDGSSAPRIRADTIRHVQSLGVAYSQMGFEDCLLFLAQPSTSGSRLILYDNVDDPDIDLVPLLPLGESCVIMVTSRNRSLGELCPEAHLELDVMSMEEAVELLLPHPVPSTTLDHLREEVGAIARALGCLPIALTQARSYMYQTQCSAGEYLERLSSSLDRLMSQPVKNHRDMRYLSTYAALNASFTLLTSRCQHLLRLLSHFHWSNFPLELVILAAKHKFSDYQSTYIEHGDEYYIGMAMLKTIFLHEGRWEVTELDEMMVLLRNHSLITVTPGVGTQLVQMHPVTHGWAKSSIPEKDVVVYRAAAVLLLALGSRTNYNPSTQYLASHVTHLGNLWDQLDINNAEAFGYVLNRAGLFENALQLRRKVVIELQNRVESDTTRFAGSTGSLAPTYSGLERRDDVGPLQGDDLGRRGEIQWSRHPGTIMASSNLAITYRHLGRLKEAEALQEDVLKFRKEVLGESHPDTIEASHNLANTYRDLGRLKEVQVLLEEVLKLRREVLGERHPDTITASNNLASTYRDLGLLKEAEMLQKGILKLSREILGERHPHTILASSSLAITYRDLGRLKEAEMLQAEVLKLRREVLGERHPESIKALHNLAYTYRKMGRLKEAEMLQEEVLKVRKEILGEHHLETIKGSHNLAGTYHEMGRLKEAEMLQEEVLNLRREILGGRHPLTIKASHNLACTYRKLGRLKEAEMLQTEVLKLRKETLGELHHETILASNNLADCYLRLGRLEDAEALQVETVRQAQEILGNEHLNTALYMLTLAEIYEALRKKSDALKILDAAELIYAEKVGKTHQDYLDCLELRSRLQALPDAPMPVTPLDPSQEKPTIAPIPPTSNAIHRSRPTRVRRLIAQVRDWVS